MLIPYAGAQCTRTTSAAHPGLLNSNAPTGARRRRRTGLAQSFFMAVD